MKQIALGAILSYVCMSQKSLNNVVGNGNKAQTNRNNIVGYADDKYGGNNLVVGNNHATIGNGINFATWEKLNSLDTSSTVGNGNDFVFGAYSNEFRIGDNIVTTANFDSGYHLY
jgi:hypothetical protein